MKHPICKMLSAASLCACLLVSAVPAADQTTATAALTMKPKVKMVTSLGDITIELDGEKAPISTLNFLRYAEEGFYNGTIFHRVMKTFMIQGGGFTPEMDKKEQGLHDPIKNEWQNALKNDRGTIAMARTNDPDSATAQFFINVVDNPFLSEPRGGAAYAVFGKVVEGMETVDKIRDAKVIEHPKYPSGQAVTPETPVAITSVTVLDTYDKAALQAQVDKAQAAALAEAAKAEESKKGALDKYIKDFETKSGKKIQKTDSGLLYAVLTEGTGASPKPTDEVVVHYRGTLLDGTEFDSSYKRNQPATFPLNRVIPGWTEGVGLMKVGGKSQLLCPPDLAYGKMGRPPVIPPDSTLAFEVELLEIKGSETPNEGAKE